MIRATNGRPRKGHKAIGPSVRSLRLPNDVWTKLEQLADERNVTLHALLRELVGAALPRPRPERRAAGTR